MNLAIGILTRMFTRLRDNLVPASVIRANVLQTRTKYQLNSQLLHLRFELFHPLSLQFIFQSFLYNFNENVLFLRIRNRNDLFHHSIACVLITRFYQVRQIEATASCALDELDMETLILTNGNKVYEVTHLGGLKQIERSND